MKTIQLIPANNPGSHRTGTLTTSYQNILDKVGPANADDDPGKVQASWSYKDDKGRVICIWCYKYWGKLELCTSWSCYGDKQLLNEIFGAAYKNESN